MHENAKNADFWEELTSENDFEAVFFCCYEHGAKAPKAVQKMLQIKISIANAPRVL